jgi:hypothetical protein
MSDFTSFLCEELTDLGLLAAADPHFAEQLFKALCSLPADTGGAAPAGAVSTGTDSARRAGEPQAVC